jgi:acetyl esterase/lipase
MDKVKPPIGRVEFVGIEGPHGTIPVRISHPSKPDPAEGGAMVSMHGGGFIVGSLDQFESAMRLLAENSGAQVYCVDYKLAPEYQWPSRWRRARLSSAGYSSTLLGAASTRTVALSVVIPQVAI